MAGSTVYVYALLGFTVPRYALVLESAALVISSVTKELAHGVNATDTGIALAEGAGVGFVTDGFATTTLLLHTNFLPLLMQV
jgi:hypothetical protein